jgi:F0F1-type ATP synthase membrane subunit c/vacuolar-type H+-ATPase subunit K
MDEQGDERWDEDPGWQLDWRVLIAVLPGGQQLLVRRSSGDNLALLRNLFVSFVSSIVLFGVVIAFIPISQHGPAGPWVGATLAVAVISLIGTRTANRPLDCSSNRSIAAGYRTQFFLRVAFAESIALFAFCFTFTNGPKWLYYFGGALTLFRMASFAPTPGALTRMQDDLAARGCSRSLVAALRHPAKD